MTNFEKVYMLNVENIHNFRLKNIPIEIYRERELAIKHMCKSINIDINTLTSIMIDKIIEDCKRHDKDQWKEVIEKYVFSDDFIYIIHEGIQLNICTILTKPKPLVRKLLKYIKER